MSLESNNKMKCWWVNELVTLGRGGKGRGRESVLRLETIASGYMNAVVFWFDLHMDEHETITTAPPGVGKGGMLLEEEEFEGDAKGLAAARQGPRPFTLVLKIRSLVRSLARSLIRSTRP